MHAHPASRSGPRDRQRLSSALQAPLAANLRLVCGSVSETLQAKTKQPAVRAQPRQVVRAGTSGRGFCRDVRRVAATALELAMALSELAGAAQARIRRRVAERDRRLAATEPRAP